MGCNLTKEQQVAAKKADSALSEVYNLPDFYTPLFSFKQATTAMIFQLQALQQQQTLTLQTLIEAGPAHQLLTLSNIKPHRSGISAVDIRADARSRRASSLAPGPDTPVAVTPFRDALHGSETGSRLSWRRTAALLQAHAQRFSSSSGLDRTFEPQHLARSPEAESSEACLHQQRADSSKSTVLGYADLSFQPTARPQQLHGMPKSAQNNTNEYDSSERLTPQSVILGFRGRSTTPSEIGDQPDQDHRESSPQQHTLDVFTAQFNLAAANLLTDDQRSMLRRSLESRDTPKWSRAERQVKRSLSSVQPRAWSLTSSHGHTSSQAQPECSSPGCTSNQPPLSNSPSLVAKRQRFQHTVPYSRPSSGSESECIEGRHAPAPLPSNELARQAALDSLDVMKNPPAEALHDIAVCAASAFQVPVVVITLIGNSTVWCQTQSGQTGHQSRYLCVGAWTLLTPEPSVIVVPDASKDPRMQYHPMVVHDPPGIRFYAAAPLLTSTGFRIGCMSILDMFPRQLDEQGQSLLSSFAGMAAHQLEQASSASKRIQHNYFLGHAAALGNAIHGFSQPMMLCDISNQQHWRVAAVNQAWLDATGICREHAEGSLLWDVFYVPDMGAGPAAQMCMESAAQQSSFSLQLASQLDQEDCLTIKTLTFLFRPTALHSSSDTVAQSFYFATIQDASQSGSQRRGSSCWVPNSSDVVHPALPHSPGTPGEVDSFAAVVLGPLLGQGGSGHVYRGLWNGATVAVKVVEAVHAKDDDNTIPLKPLEAMLSIDLAHPNIIHTFKFYTRIRQEHASLATEGSDAARRKVSETWLVLEYCSKGSLQDALDRGWFRSRKVVMDGSADLESIITTATEIASAMAYLHGLDILHGDLSGSNILLACNSDDERGFTAKVADFGLARMLGEGEVVQTRAIGTITHMPPELMLDGSMSHAVDVYAFGVVLWEMYTAQRPWAGMRQAQIVHTVCSLGQQLEFPYGTPTRFEELGMACMHPDPEERPSFTQIIGILEELSELVEEDPLEMMSEGYPMHIL